MDFKTIVPICVILCTLALGLPAPRVDAYATGITGYSGNPASAARGAICNDCHFGGATPTVRFEGPSSVPTGAMAVFRFVVHSNAPTQQKAAGFDVSVDAGQLAIIAGQGAQLALGEITHTSPKAIDSSAEAAWEFTLIAPASPINVTLYGAGNSVHRDGSSAGDAAASVAFSFNVVSAAPTPTPTATPEATSTPAPSQTPTATATAMPVATDTPPIPPTLGPSPTPTATRVPGSCVGDCDNRGSVTVDELVVGVRIALDAVAPDFCPAADANHDGKVTVEELVAAVNAALNGCPP